MTELREARRALDRRTSGRPLPARGAHRRGRDGTGVPRRRHGAADAPSRSRSCADPSTGSATVERALSETMLLASLNHHGLVTLFDAHVVGGRRQLPRHGVRRRDHAAGADRARAARTRRGRRRSPSTSPRACTPPTRRASSTATSSRRTSCCGSSPAARARVAREDRRLRHRLPARFHPAHDARI